LSLACEELIFNRQCEWRWRLIARSHGDPTNGLIRQQWVDWSSSVDRFVVISGCSSSGKSTLIGELGNRGYGVVDEPGRRIVKEELASGGSALPWIDGIAFARRAITMALADRAAAHSLYGWVFFDRGLIDAAAALQHLTGEPALATLGQANRYHRRVFLTPALAGDLPNRSGAASRPGQGLGRVLTLAPNLPVNRLRSLDFA
jgi:predicted ATPase